MAQLKSSAPENFSITNGGPLHWLLVRLGHAGDERRLILRRALAVVLITCTLCFSCHSCKGSLGDDRSQSPSFGTSL
jgi:hypothetical protein